jgi:hypothetical protein
MRINYSQEKCLLQGIQTDSKEKKILLQERQNSLFISLEVGKSLNLNPFFAAVLLSSSAQWVSKYISNGVKRKENEICSIV